MIIEFLEANKEIIIKPIPYLIVFGWLCIWYSLFKNLYIWAIGREEKDEINYRE